ncbi:hypothetical protein [Microbacterium sp. SORGH_AS_0888]|uniref:hypothetical protein n=1 Tax=Microbacterium sp. SORGH_AS_0888 TaxID=3041791 RepID=UPI002783D05F|nr:hypothetical protein [Microbacterium sp. SORGH_AS_0888]MDQ1130939.1 hypothetical protein [Microbacterium sp. SORGH_AS_0888]
MHGKPYATVKFRPAGLFTPAALEVTFDEPHDYPEPLVERGLHHAKAATRYLSAFFGVHNIAFFEKSTSQALSWLLLNSDQWNDPRLSEEEEHDAASSLRICLTIFSESR